jgi:hypothetical protein
MVPKHELPKNIHLDTQGPNYGVGVCELEDHVGEKELKWNWPTKFGPTKKTPFGSFLSYMLKSAGIKFVFLYVSSPYHERAKWDTIEVTKATNAKLPHYISPSIVYLMKEKCHLYIMS